MGKIKVLDGATLEFLGNGVYELRQMFSFSDEEVMGDVAKKMIGPAGTAKLISVGYDEEGDQWPTAVYHGVKKSLEALHAIASGSAIGRPKRQKSTFGPLVVAEGVEPDFEIPEADPDLHDCDYCGEPEGEGDDVLAEWVTDEKTDSQEFVTKMAHGQCGEDAGWKLA